jgi:hypothetical protein
MRRQQGLTARARLIIAGGVAGVTMLLASPPAIYALSHAQAMEERQASSGKFYIVQAGRSGALPQLSQVAQETLGDEGRWKELMELNRGIEQPDGGRLDDSKRLRTGWVLKLPDDASGEHVRSGLAVAPNPAAAAKARKAAMAAAAKRAAADRKAAAAARASAAKTTKAVREARAARKARAAKARRPVFDVPTAGVVEQRVPQFVPQFVPQPQVAPRRNIPAGGGMDKDGLTPRARAAMEEVKAVFGVTNIGGFCPGGCKSGHISKSDHYTGHAIDIMLRPINETNRALGDTIASYLVANGQRLGVKYIVWNEMIWSTRRQAEGWRPYRHPSGNTTNPTLAHRDHVHLSVI